MKKCVLALVDPFPAFLCAKNGTGFLSHQVQRTRRRNLPFVDFRSFGTGAFRTICNFGLHSFVIWIYCDDRLVITASLKLTWFPMVKRPQASMYDVTSKSTGGFVESYCSGYTVSVQQFVCWAFPVFHWLGHFKKVEVGVDNWLLSHTHLVQ